MQVHALDLEDFSEEAYSLIGIETTLEDYKLAYLLNKNLQTQFYKSEEDLKFESKREKASFSIFNFSSIKFDFEWFLISNTFTREDKLKNNQLLLITETKIYLIPEKKKVDFFIKISGNVPSKFVANIIDQIKSIAQVKESYPIDKNTLKSKDFLII